MEETVVTTVKPWYTSKVIWLNGLTIAAALLVWLLDSQNAGTLPFVLDGRWVAFILGAVNFALRFITNQPVSGGAKPMELPRSLRE